MNSNDSKSRYLKPQQLVLVFTNDAASGATLGYYGIVVGLDETSVDQNPVWHDQWIYFVHIPYLNANYRIRGCHLIATDHCNSSDTQLGPACQIQFESEIAADNYSICGRYRTAGRTTWNTFRFSKTDAAMRNFQLSLPVADGSQGPSTLRYYVPSGDVLDREYVLLALGEVCGNTDWRDVTPKRQPT